MNLFSITCSANNIPFPSFLDTARTCFLSFLIFECNSRSADLIWPNWTMTKSFFYNYDYLPNQFLFNDPFPFFGGSFIWLPTCWKEHFQGLSEVFGSHWSHSSTLGRLLGGSSAGWISGASSGTSVSSISAAASTLGCLVSETKNQHPEDPYIVYKYIYIYIYMGASKNRDTTKSSI